MKKVCKNTKSQTIKSLKNKVNNLVVRLQNSNGFNQNSNGFNRNSNGFNRNRNDFNQNIKSCAKNKVKLAPLKTRNIARFYFDFAYFDRDLIIFPLKVVYKKRQQLLEYALALEKEIKQNFEEFEVEDNSTKIEIAAKSFLDNFLRQFFCKTKASFDLSKNFVQHEKDFGSAFGMVFMLILLEDIKQNIVDLQFFEKEVWYGNKAFKLSKNPSSAFFYGVAQKNSNAAKLILHANVNIKREIDNFICELLDIEKQLDILFCLLESVACKE